MKTALTEMLNLKTPLLMGGLQWISTGEFVGQMAEAGVLSFISASSYKNPEEVEEQIIIAKGITKNPFGVNISMLPDASVGDGIQALLDIVIKHDLKVIETSGKSPKEIVSYVKPRGIKTIHKVPQQLRYAKSAVEAGADAVTVVGNEAGGHPGLDGIGGMVSFPLVAESLDVPVIFAGGFADGKTLAAALAMGAAGVVMGTRFLATKECPVHDNIKNWMVNAKETDTIMVQHSIRNALRSMKNDHAYKVLGLETNGAQLRDLIPYISGEVGKKALKEGNLDSSLISMGQVVARIHSIPTAKELVEEIMAECKATIERLNA